MHRATEKDLADLRAADVADAAALRIAAACGAPAEILRAAIELELSHVATLPSPSFDPECLTRMTSLVPELEGFEVRAVRALGIRGRAYPRVILVGAPGIAGADADHVAWQAAHEAIVATRPHASFIEIERSAIATLRARARKAGLGDDHARWLGRFDLSALGTIPDVPDGA